MTTQGNIFEQLILGGQQGYQPPVPSPVQGNILEQLVERQAAGDAEAAGAQEAPAEDFMDVGFPTTEAPEMDPLDALINQPDTPQWITAMREGVSPAFRQRQLQDLLKEATGEPREQKAGEVWRGFVDRPASAVPFLGSIVEAVELHSVWKAADRIESGEFTTQDIELLGKFFYQTNVDKTGPAIFADIVTQLPSFAGEIFLTGGLYTAGRVAARKAIAKMLTQAIRKTVIARVGTSVAGVAAGSAAQLPAFSHRAVATSIRRSLPTVTEDESGQLALVFDEGDEDFTSAVVNHLGAGYLDTFIELFSERTGAALGILPGAKALTSLKTAVLSRWLRVKPGNTASVFLNRIATRAGWNGVLGEVFEERVAEVLKGVTGLEEYTLPSGKQLAAEALAFAIPGAAITAAQIGAPLDVGPKAAPLAPPEPGVEPTEVPTGPLEAPTEAPAAALALAPTVAPAVPEPSRGPEAEVAAPAPGAPVVPVEQVAFQRLRAGVERARETEFLPAKPDEELRKQGFDAIRWANREIGARLFTIDQNVRGWKATVPKESEREDITAFVEDIGNPNRKGDTISDVQARMTPAMKNVAEKYQAEQELVRTESNKLFEEAGSGTEYIRYLSSYVAHIYNVSPKRALEFAGQWRKSTPHAKGRKFPTYADAIKAGLVPETLDIVELYRRSAENNFRAAVTRKLIRKLRDMRAVDGRHVIVGSAENSDPGWVKIDHHVFKHVYSYKNEAGELVLGEGNAWVHPSLAGPIKSLIDSPFQNRFTTVMDAINKGGKAINVAFSLFHEFALFESAQAALMQPEKMRITRGFLVGPIEKRRLGIDERWHAGILPIRTYKAGLLLMENDPLGTEDAIRHGLTLGRMASADFARAYGEKRLRSLEQWLKQHPAGSIPAYALGKIRWGYEAYQSHLWDNVYVGLKVFAYNDHVSRFLADPPAGFSDKKIKETVASYVNDMFGGQEFIELPIGKWGKFEPITVKMNQAAHALVFAPDWTLSNIRVAGRPLANPKNPILRRMGFRYWTNMALSLVAFHSLMQAMIKLSFGQDDPDMEMWIWNNEKGRKWDIDVTPVVARMYQAFGKEPPKQRSYIHAGKQAREVLRYMTDFPNGLMTTLGSKLSVGVRMVVEQLAGHSPGSEFPMPWTDTGFREGIEGWEQVISRGKSAGEHFLPFSWQSNQFLFALPKRKGMTPYRAQLHFKDALQAYADPSWWNKIKDKVDPDTRDEAFTKIVDEIDDALEKNGFSENRRKQIFINARSRVRAIYYREFWEAFDNQDVDEIERVSKILEKLGITGKDIKASARRRQ